MKKKNILSVITAALLSVCLLSVNCLAFEFEGENRSFTDIYSDWFLSTRDFVTGQSSFEQWRNSNIRFQTDIIGSNLFPGTENELQSYISEIEEKLQTAVEGTDNKVDDAFIDTLGGIVGFFDFRSDFEQWYQDKYGKEYYRKDFPSGTPFPDNSPSGYSYYLNFYESNYSYEHQYIINYSGAPIPVYPTDDGGLYFLGTSVNCTRKIRHRTKSSGEWGEWGDWFGEYSGSLGTARFSLRGDCGGEIVIGTNLPFDFSTANGDDDCVGGGGGDGELVAPGLTLPEIGDLLTDLGEDLKNTDSNPDNPNKGVEIKITQLTNKLHNDLSKVIDYLKKILDKLTEFFNKFIDNFDNFFENLGEFFESVFVPQDDYFNNIIMDISAEFDEVFSFGSSLKSNIDYFLDCYNTTPSNSITLGGYKISFAIFDKVINVIRYTIAIPIYFCFAFRTYRKLPVYIKGGASE